MEALDIVDFIIFEPSAWMRMYVGEVLFGARELDLASIIQ